MARLGTTLVFLYGPPGVGKLTVATALARLTGYRVFHNHVTINAIRTLFDWDDPPFWPLVDRYRVELLGAAAKARLPGVITTFVYAEGHDDAFVARVVRAVRRHGGRVRFVRLTCDRAELLRRVRIPSRRAFGKMHEVSHLRRLLARYDLFADVPYAENLVIDTTALSPRRAARRIVEHFRLRPRSGRAR